MLAEHQLSAGSNAKNDDMASARQVRPRCPYPALPRYSGVGDPAMAGDPGIITAALIENQVRT